MPKSCGASFALLYLGEKLGDTSALENPGSLDQIKLAAK